MDKDSLELLLARGNSVEEIGRRFGKRPSTVRHWIEKYGLEAASREKREARGRIDRELLEELVKAGCTISEIAAEIDRCAATVRRWLSRYGLRTQKSQRAERQRSARNAGAAVTTLLCSVHGETEFAISNDGYYRCRRCRVESVSRRRRRVKEVLVLEAGGRCSVCGYDRYLGALQFHHLDPSAKRIALAQGGVTLALDVLRREAEKCALLCSNCHAEVEAGVTVLPGRVGDR